MFDDYWFLLQRNSLDEKPNFDNNSVKTDNDNVRGREIMMEATDHKSFQSDKSAEQHQ